MDTSTIKQEALHLKMSERAKFAYKLLLSIDDMSGTGIEEVWFDEAERRAREIDQGLVRLIPVGEVSRKARDLLM